MKKLLALIGVMLLCVMSSYATLIDSENFETYTNWADGSNINAFFLEAANRWQCSQGFTAPTCYSCASDGCNGFHNFSISSEGLNNYMSIWAYTPYCTIGGSAVKKYYMTSLHLNFTNSTNPALLAGTPMNYIINMSVKPILVSDPYNSPQSCSGNNMFRFHAGWFDGWQINGTGQYGGMLVGGVAPTNASLETFSRLRPIYYSSYTSGGAKPADSDCDINDGNWHQIWTIYRVNGSNYLRNYSIYVDGAQCFYYEYPLGLGTQPFFHADQSPPIFPKFQANAVWSMQYDNISICEANATLAANDSCYAPAYECSDGIDNDADGYTDYGSDPSCSSVVDDSEAPADNTQCNDGIDNDGDGFVDWGIDPQCDSAIDNTEAPYEYTQCNNGIDDDGDSLIDLSDPSCTSLMDNDEFPQDATQQSSSSCLVQNRCVLKETFPYTDNITLHGWYGSVANLKTYTTITPHKLMQIHTSSYYNAILNATNPNIYDKVRIDFMVWVSPFSDTALPPESFYLKFLDSSNNEVIKLRFDLKNTGDTPFMNTTISNVITYPVGNVTELWRFIPCTSGACTTKTPVCVFDTTIWGFDIGFICHTVKSTNYPEYSYMTFELYADQTLKEYELYFTDWNGQKYHYNAALPFSNTLSSKISKVAVENINLTTNWYVYLEGIGVHGDLSEFTTTCDTWQLPYYLKESFNGYPSQCGWTTTDNTIYFVSSMQLETTTPHYYIQKQFDTVTSDATRYTTVQWDMNVQNITGVGSFTMRLYDTTGYNFLATYMLDASTMLMYNGGGTSKDVTNVTLGTSVTYKVIIDSQSDTFDVYANGTKVLSGANFISDFYNLESFNKIKFDVSYFGITIDNIAIYASDGSGSSLLPSEDITPMASNTTQMCGLFYKTAQKCITDADCVTGDCLPQGSCNRFDMTYCDEHGYIRGNKCILGGIALCVAKSTSDVLLNNILYVLVFIVLLIAFVYFSIMLRRRGS